MKKIALGLMLIVTTPAIAEQTFDKMWEERILSMVRSNTRAPTIVAEQQEPAVEKKETPIVEREHKPKRNACMTLEEARQKYGRRVYLSWRGKHCWFSPD